MAVFSTCPDEAWAAEAGIPCQGCHLEEMIANCQGGAMTQELGTLDIMITEGDVYGQIQINPKADGYDEVYVALLRARGNASNQHTCGRQ